MSVKKKVLLVQYSQSGQLNDVARSVTKPLEASDTVELHTLTLTPEKPFPFPWSVIPFFNIFPECVYLDPPALQPLDIDTNQKFDLVIIAYQVCFSHHHSL